MRAQARGVAGGARGLAERLLASRFPVFLLGNAAGAALGLALLVVATRLLGPEGFGRLASLVNFLDMGVFLVDMAIFSGAVHLAARDREADPARAAMALKIAFLARLALAAAFAGAGALAAPAIARFLFGEAAHVLALRAVFVSVLAAAVYTQAISALLSRGSFGRLALVTPLKNAARLALLGALAALGLATPDGAAMAYAGAAVAAAGLALLACRFDFLAVPGFDRGVAREMFGINKWAVVAAFGMLGLRLDIIMLERLGAPAQVGFYAAAAQLVIVVTLVSQSLANYLFPGVSALSARAEMRAHARRCLGLARWAAVPALLLPPLAAWAAPLALGEDYAGMTDALGLMLLGAVLTLAINPLGLLFFPLGRVDVLAKAALGLLALKALLNLLLAPEFGAAGVAAGDLAAKVAVNGLMLVFLARLLRRREPCLEGGAP